MEFPFKPDHLFQSVDWSGGLVMVGLPFHLLERGPGLSPHIFLCVLELTEQKCHVLGLETMEVGTPRNTERARVQMRSSTGWQFG